MQNLKDSGGELRKVALKEAFGYLGSRLLIISIGFLALFPLFILVVNITIHNFNPVFAFMSALLLVLNVILFIGGMKHYKDLISRSVWEEIMTLKFIRNFQGDCTIHSNDGGSFSATPEVLSFLSRNIAVCGAKDSIAGFAATLSEKDFKTYLIRYFKFTRLIISVTELELR